MRLFQRKATPAATRAPAKRAAKRPTKRTTVRRAKRTTRATARKMVRKKAARRPVRKKPARSVIKKRAVRKKAVLKARPVRKAARVRKKPVRKAVTKKMVREKKVRRARPVRRPVKKVARVTKRKVARKRMPLRERVEKRAAAPVPSGPKKAPPKIGEINFKIENIVASANLEVELDLYGIAREVDNVEYEPEQFPGAILKLKEPKTSLLLFKNGKLICTGAKSKDDVERAINKAYGLIQDCIRS
jgi:hypothetical protein